MNPDSRPRLGRSTATLDDVVALLERLVQAVERQSEQRPESQSSLSRSDRERLSALLPVVIGVFGSEVINSAEILEHDSHALRLVCAGLTVKQLGRLLRRGADRPIEGHMVLRLGSEAGAVLWRIVQVPEFPREQKPFCSSRAVGQGARIDGEE